MAVLQRLGDLIADEINARLWSRALVAVRSNRASIDRETAETIHVTVVPVSKKRTRITRGVIQDICTFAIGVQQAVATTGTAYTDDLIALCEEIQAHFDEGNVLTGEDGIKAVCEDTSLGGDSDSPILATEESLGLLLYTGVVSVTFRVHR